MCLGPTTSANEDHGRGIGELPAVIDDFDDFNDSRKHGLYASFMTCSWSPICSDISESEVLKKKNNELHELQVQEARDHDYRVHPTRLLSNRNCSFHKC